MSIFIGGNLKLSENPYKQIESRKGYKKLIFLVSAFAVILIFRSCIMERVIISGNSMFPTLCNEDVCMAWKMGIEPERNDIVIAKVNGATVIKRVVGLPGDTLSVIDGRLALNGNPVSDYDFEISEAGLLQNGYVVPQDSYFLLGDNREESCDSREYGAVEKDKIKGIVILRFYPFTEITVYSR